MLYINDDIESVDIGKAAGLLSEQRMAQVMRLRDESHRRQSVAAYLLLREALAAEHGITGAPVFGRLDGGKPFIAGRPDISFSMSHCRRGVACALCNGPVGVDIESIRPYNGELARRVLNRGEQSAVEAAVRPDVEFIRLWTMKESYMKMTGEGIRSDLKRVPLDTALFTSTVNVARGYVCTVCTPHGMDVTPHDVSAPPHNSTNITHENIK